MHVHPKGYMDKAGMRLWIQNVREKNPGALLKMLSLVLDSDLILQNQQFKMCKTEMTVIPGGLASQLQPLDVSIKVVVNPL